VRSLTNGGISVVESQEERRSRLWSLFVGVVFGAHEPEERVWYLVALVDDDAGRVLGSRRLRSRVKAVRLAEELRRVLPEGDPEALVRRFRLNVSRV
jgi:hypothetical protein